MLHAFLSILPLFLLIVSGYFAKKYFLKEEVFWKTSDKLTYYLFFPSLLILKIGTTDFSTAFPMGALYATLGATFLIALLLFVSKGVFKIENALFTSIFQGAIRYNSYVFIAMSQSLFGEEGVAFSGVFVAYMIVFTNIISVLVLNHYGDGEKKDIWGIFKALLQNPLILGALFGAIINYLQWSIPQTFAHYMHYLADAATPMSLLSVGAGLSLVMHWTKLTATMYAALLKLLALPFATFFLLSFFAVDGMAAHIALLYAASPCAGNAYILARQMGGDAQAMASIITWTTLISALTISLWMA